MFAECKKALWARRIGLAFVLLVFNFADAHGWGSQGHIVVGYVAEFNLDVATKKNIKKEFNINHLADVATWADMVRKKKEEEKPWHYTNIREGEWTYEAARDCPDGNCVVAKLKEFSGVLANIENPQEKRKDALKYIVHFVADVHQPLHLGNQKDRGGNNIRTYYLGNNVNLHYLWDGGLIHWKNKSLLKYATRLNSRVTDSEKLEWLNSNIDEWANESRSYALKFAYPIGERELTKEYVSRSREILDQRMVQAGVRLADLLNKIFHSEK
ncbi:MAG: S1/P1 nuclease [Nitrospinota bacterium]